MRLCRFRLRSLMAAVAVIALLLADSSVSYSWWKVRPLLYLVVIPLVSAVPLCRRPPRALIGSGTSASDVA